MRTRVSIGVEGVKGAGSALGTRSTRCGFSVFGIVALMSVGWASLAQAQLSNSPLYQPSPTLTPTSERAWQGVHDGSAPTYVPAPRYPADSRNLSLDNRSPSLRSVTPDLRDPTPRPGSLREDEASGRGLRRSDGLRAPGVAEPARPSWR